jgi:hypothetical protein
MLRGVAVIGWRALKLHGNIWCNMQHEAAGAVLVFLYCFNAVAKTEGQRGRTSRPSAFLTVIGRRNVLRRLFFRIKR